VLAASSVLADSKGRKRRRKKKKKKRRRRRKKKRKRRKRRKRRMWNQVRVARRKVFRTRHRWTYRWNLIVYSCCTSRRLLASTCKTLRNS